MSFRKRLSFFTNANSPSSAGLNSTTHNPPVHNCRQSRSRFPIEQVTPVLDRSMKMPEQRQRLDLSALRSGDLLRIVTENTIYNFSIVGPEAADLSTNRTDRPSGQVQLRGCTFGVSSCICADFLLCGANLEFLLTATRKVYKTSEIQAIFWVNRG